MNWVDLLRASCREQALRRMRSRRIWRHERTPRERRQHKMCTDGLGEDKTPVAASRKMATTTVRALSSSIIQRNSSSQLAA